MTRKNSRILFCFTLSLAVWPTFATLASAQGRMRSPESVGLTQVWSKAVATGLGGKISGVHLHLSSTDTYQANEVVDRFGRRQFFSDLDTKAVSVGGHDPTQRLTELKNAELAARGLDPKIESRSIPRATLYVRSTSGLVTAMDAETGQVKWTVQAGKQGYPSYSVAASDEYVVALSSTRMFLIDARSGQILDTVSTQSIPSGTPTIDGDHIYVPTWRGLIEVYSTENFGRVQFTLGSTSPVVGTVTVCPDAISWVTDQGDLYVGNRQSPGVKFRFQTPDTISSAPAYLDNTLFATSLDGFVYAIDDTRGNVKWRHSAGGPIDVSPLAVDNLVFATTRDGQLACLDAKTGEPKWRASGVERFVSASQNRLYCATIDDRLAVIDMATGARIGSQPIGSADLAIVNTATDRLYMASNQGVMTCLRESGRRWPIVRMQSINTTTDPETTEDEMTNEATEAPISPSAEDDVAIDVAIDVPNDFAADEVEDAATDVGEDDGGDPFGEFDAGGEDSGFDLDMDAGGEDSDDDPFGDL